MISLMTKGLINILERELLSYEPQIQQFMVSELEKAVQLLVQYINSKKGI